MTHQDECSPIRDLVDLAIEHGPDAMAAAVAALMNHAMQIEREQVLKAESHQRTADRHGYANGFKPKILNTRVGQVGLRIPQTRGERAEKAGMIDGPARKASHLLPTCCPPATRRAARASTGPRGCREGYPTGR